MPDKLRILFQGQLAASPTTIYTVGGGSAAIVKHVNVRETHPTASHPFTLWVNGTDDAHEWQGATLAPDESLEFNGALALEEGSFIAASAGSAAVVSTVISGLEVG